MQSTRSGRAFATIAMAVLVAAGVAGCGSSGGSEGATTPKTSTATKASTAPKTSAAPTSGPETTPDTATATTGDSTDTTAPDTTTAAPTIAPCDALTKAEADKIAGLTLQAGNAVEQTCTYTAPVDGPTGQVEIYLGEGAKSYLDVDRQIGHTFEPVPGLGDEAFYEEDTVFFRKGQTWVAIQLVRTNDPAENKAPLIDAAKVVAGRL